MTTEEQTPNYGLHLPHPTNDLAVDVARLRQALQTADMQLKSLGDGLAGKSASGHSHQISDIAELAQTISELQSVSAPSVLDELDDVDASEPANNHVLLRQASAWISAQLGIGHISQLTEALNERPSQNSVNTALADKLDKSDNLASLTDAAAARANISALATTGGTVSGVIEANSPTAALRSIAANGSAQIKMERTGAAAGVGYIGADEDNALMVFDGSLSTLLNVTQDGHLQMPNKPIFAGYGPPTSRGSGVAVYGTITSNVGSCYNPATGVFTCPISGKYRVTAFEMKSSTALSGTVEIRVQKNGILIDPHAYNKSDGSSDDYGQVSYEYIHDVLEGDTLTIYISRTGTTMLYGTVYSAGTIEFLG